LHQDCADDVSITISSQWGVIEPDTYTLKTPPDYKAGDDIRIYYDVTNSSCDKPVDVTVKLRGSESDAPIHNADATDDMACFEGCTINAGGTLYGNIGWDLGKHPNATGEKVVATVTITAPDGFVDADTSNNTATSAQSINIVNEEPEPAPDIAVKSVSASKTTAVIGETVNFTVSVQNEGDADAEADTTVTLDHGADTTALDSDTVSALAVDGESSVTLTWDTDGAAAGAHSLRALAQTEGDDNADNDSKTETVTLVERSVDVAVKSVTASATEAVVGDTVDFTVTLENDGNVAAVLPDVSLYDADGPEDAGPLASVTAGTIAVGDETTAAISWDTDAAAAGTYSLRVVAAVDGDDDSTNDSATASFTLHDPVDVELSFTSSLASSAVQGNSVSVLFTLTNSGKNDTGEVLVNLYVAEVGQDQTTEDAASDGTDGAEEEDDEPTATATISTLAVNGSTSGTLTWDTTDAVLGNYELELVAVTAGDIDDTNNSTVDYIEIRNWLLLKNVSPTDAEAVTGDTVKFTAQVENVGQEELTDLTVGLYETRGNEALASVTIDTAAAGDTADAAFQWDTAGRDAGQVHLFVSVGADGQVLDEDDTQKTSVIVRNPIVLSSATPASEDNVAGIPVSINVEVLNESIDEATGVEVKLDGVGSCDDENRNKEKDCATPAAIAAIPAGETGAAVLEWHTAKVEPGEHALKIVASVDGYSSDANDVLPLTVTLRAPVMAVALTSATINRDVAAVGQSVEVTATIANHGEVPVATPVALYLVAELEQTPEVARETSLPIEPGAKAEVTLRWDSTGEDTGTHTLKIVTELPEDTTGDDNEDLLTVELFRSAFDGAHDVDSCVEDVRVRVTEIKDLSGQIRSPPNYLVGEQLKAAYRIYNFSCQTDITLAVTMSGPEDHAISDSRTLCFANCVVPFGGKAEGEIAWTIPTLPALGDQPINATVTIVTPEDFVDVDDANNSNTSADRMNIVHPEDLVVRLGEQNDEKVSTRQSLTGPEFGAVDVRLVSVHPLQATLPFAAATVEVAVAVANDGPTTEPATVRFVLSPTDGTQPQELYGHTMVIPTGETRTETVAVPLRDVLPGTHSIEVLLSAAVDRSLNNNTQVIEITRREPLVDVEVTAVSISPEMPFLGDAATVTLTVQNNSDIALPLTVNLFLDNALQTPAEQDLGELAASAQLEKVITWRLPASGKYLGQRTLKLALISTEYGRVVEVSRDVTLHIDAEIVSVDAVPVDTAMQGEEVAIEVEVRNNGPATVNVPVALHFPSETKDPETRSPKAPAGTTGTASFTWKTTNYAVGEHMLTATVPEQHNIASGATSMELPFRVSPLVVTATIVDVSAYPTTPTVGEPVTITVTVRNDGRIAANIPVTLHFPPGGRQPHSKKPRLDPGETGTVVFEWLTGNYQPGTHQFLVEVAAVDAPQQRFTIDLLPIVENVALVGMGTFPVETAMVGEPVEVWIDVHNDGPVALNVPVRLTFPSASESPEVRSPRVAPGETARVWFEWKTSNYEPGIHTLRAAILLAGNLTLGRSTGEIRFTLTPLVINATIVDVAVNPEEPRVGEPVTITVTVRNDGRIAANIPVTLHFPPGGRQPDSKKPRVEPGAVGSVSFTWRTSRYEPGMHAFLVEAPGDPPSSQRFEIGLLPPIVDVAIVGMGSDPSETAVQGQEVSIWVDVINNGPSALSVPVQLSFPSGDKQPERKSSRIEPGEIVRIEFTWKTSNYDPGTHTLTATLLAEYNITELDTYATIQIRLISAQLIASIVEISWNPDSPVVGEPVTITVTVRNDGIVAANIPVTLHFPPGGRQPHSKKPRLDPGETGTVVFEWLTGNYHPGTHRFLVEVAAVDGPQQRFTIELLPIVENVALVGMGTYPVETAMVGEPVEVWIDVRNDGPVAVRVPVRLTFPSASKRPEVRSPRVAPGETARVWFEWKTSNYEPGIHTLRAATLLAGNLTLGRTTGEIRFTLTPLVINATIVDVAVNPEEPRVGEPVTITVTVRNDGQVAANIPVTLHFPPGGRQPDSKKPRVEPGAVGAVSFTWRTSRYEPGIHAFLVEAPGDPPSSQRFEIELLPPIVNVAIVGMGSDPSETAVQGQEVKIWVDVINNGPLALNVPVQLSFPSGDKQPERKSSRIEPGEIVRIEFTWKTSNYDPGTHTLTATLLAEYNITELDTSAAIQIRLISAQLIASIVEISWNPDSPVVGEPVRITVTVRNDGIVAANIPVTLHFPSGDRQPETRRPRVARGGVGTASFTWRTSRYEPGDHVFRVQIPGMAGATRTFEIGLRPPEVDFAIAGFEAPDPSHPIVKGDWVEMTVVVQNQGPYAGRGTVYLLDSASLDTMYEQGASLEPGESREVEFTWKTLRYPVGGYELLARVDAEYDTDPDNDESERVHVHLLTDRDITVGFGNNVRPAVFSEPTSGADLSSIPRYRNDIMVVVRGQILIDLPASPALDSPMGVSPKPTGGNYDPPRMYWQWRSAQLSPWECARYQGTIGESLPRAVLCPRAPSVVR